MTAKQPDFAELNALAIEACDMWQEHLSTLAHDPSARAELTRFLEPQRRLFADWVSMMQQGGSTASTSPQNPSAGSPSTGMHQAGGSHDSNSKWGGAQAPDIAPTPIADPEPQPAPRSDEHGDDALRVAQLAYRVAELEKRLVQLESALTNANGSAASSRRAQRTAS
jgi:hypothetical protein